MAFVQALQQAGEITVAATSPGLESSSLAIQCEAATPRPAVA
jgi:hypothetical protein